MRRLFHGAPLRRCCTAARLARKGGNRHDPDLTARLRGALGGRDRSAAARRRSGGARVARRPHRAVAGRGRVRSPRSAWWASDVNVLRSAGPSVRDSTEGPRAPRGVRASRRCRGRGQPSIRPRTESLRAPCSPSDPSPYPWVRLMHQKPRTGICKSAARYPRTGPCPLRIVSAASPAR